MWWQFSGCVNRPAWTHGILLARATYTLATSHYQHNSHKHTTTGWKRSWKSNRIMEEVIKGRDKIRGMTNKTKLKWLGIFLNLNKNAKKFWQDIQIHTHVIGLSNRRFWNSSTFNMSAATAMWLHACEETSRARFIIIYYNSIALIGILMCSYKTTHTLATDERSPTTDVSACDRIRRNDTIITTFYDGRRGT